MAALGRPVSACGFPLRLGRVRRHHQMQVTCRSHDWWYLKSSAVGSSGYANDLSFRRRLPADLVTGQAVEDEIPPAVTYDQLCRSISCPKRMVSCVVIRMPTYAAPISSLSATCVDAVA